MKIIKCLHDQNVEMERHITNFFDKNINSERFERYFDSEREQNTADSLNESVKYNCI